MLSIRNITILVLTTLMLSACMRPEVQVIRTPIDIPMEKFQCEEASIRPSGDVIMESEVARYINSLEFANKDCKTRLRELSVIIQCFNEPKCDMPTLIKYIQLVDEIKKNPQDGIAP